VSGGEVILSAENSGNLRAVWASPRSCCGSLQRSLRPRSQWGGCCCLLLKNPSSRPSALRSWSINEKSWACIAWIALHILRYVY